MTKATFAVLGYALTGVMAATFALAGLTTGASLISVTVTVNWPVVVPPRPSLTTRRACP